jgi:hypothetical protein
MVKEAPKRGASMNPDDFSEGGLLDNVNVTWKECRFEMWDYDGKVPSPAPALKVVMEVEDGDPEATQYWSAGNAKDWEPSEDGTELVPIGSATGLNKGSNLALLLASLIKAGYPKTKMGSKASDFEGLVCHMVREKAPTRTGLPAQAVRADGRTFEKTVLVVDKIMTMPGEKTKGKSTGAKTGTTAATEEAGVDIGGLTTDTIVGILEANPKGLDKKKLVQQVYQKLRTDANRNEALAWAQEDANLEAGPWEYAGGILKAMS